MPADLPCPTIRNCTGMIDDALNPAEKTQCLKITDLPQKCFHCMHADDDAEFPKCKECEAFTLGCEMIDGVLESICFNCYYLKLSHQFQEDVSTGKIAATQK